MGKDNSIVSVTTHLDNMFSAAVFMETAGGMRRVADVRAVKIEGKWQRPTINLVGMSMYVDDVPALRKSLKAALKIAKEFISETASTT